MRKLLYVMLLVIPVLIFASVGIGSAAEPAIFNFIIPQVVGVEIGTDPVQWDFGNMPGFPPDPFSFPAYYEPTTPPNRPHQTIDYLVWGFGGADWELMVEGNGDPAPACGIPLGDIEYLEDDGVGGELTAWVPFTTSGVAVKSGNANTGGWAKMYQDYQVNITGDEILTGGSTCTITYTIQSL